MRQSGNVAVTVMMMLFIVLLMMAGMAFIYIQMNAQKEQIKQMERSWRDSSQASNLALEHYNRLTSAYTKDERIINTTRGACLDKDIPPQILKVLTKDESASLDTNQEVEA